MVFPKEGYSWIRNTYLRYPKATPNEKIVYLVIASHGDSESDFSRVSIENIERETGLSNKTVIKMLKLIQARGLIEITKSKRPDGGTGKNEYKIINTYELLDITLKTEVPGVMNTSGGGVMITHHYNNNT